VWLADGTPDGVPGEPVDMIREVLLDGLNPVPEKIEQASFFPRVQVLNATQVYLKSQDRFHSSLEKEPNTLRIHSGIQFRLPS
jgi:hypothetical protein